MERLHLEVEVHTSLDDRVGEANGLVEDVDYRLNFFFLGQG